VPFPTARYNEVPFDRRIPRAPHDRDRGGATGPFGRTTGTVAAEEGDPASRDRDSPTRQGPWRPPGDTEHGGATRRGPWWRHLTGTLAAAIRQGPWRRPSDRDLGGGHPTGPAAPLNTTRAARPDRTSGATQHDHGGATRQDQRRHSTRPRRPHPTGPRRRHPTGPAAPLNTTTAAPPDRTTAAPSERTTAARPDRDPRSWRDLDRLSGVLGRGGVGRAQDSAATRSSHSSIRALNRVGCSICRLWPATSRTAKVARG
jgi:hypothetical protein